MDDYAKSAIKRLENRTYYEPNTGCWLWGGAHGYNGYGRIYAFQKLWYCHRLSHHLLVRPVTSDVVVCHKCDTPACWNPDHLFAGTQKDNARDMLAKGRFIGYDKSGLNNPRNKLSEDDVLEIKRHLLETRMKHREIGEVFGVGKTAVSDINRGRKWSYLTGASQENWLRTGRCCK